LTSAARSRPSVQQSGAAGKLAGHRSIGRGSSETGVLRQSLTDLDDRETKDRQQWK